MNISNRFSKVMPRLVSGAGLLAVVSIVMVAPSFASAAALSRQMDIGTQGTDVSLLQTFLAQDPTLYPQGLVTSYFGSLTSAAVSNFQTRNNLDAVGRVGPLTLAALNAQMGSNTTGLNKTSPSISSVVVIPGSTSVTINWNTSQNSSAAVYYNTAPLGLTEGSPSTAIMVSGNSFLVSASLSYVHSAVLTGLQPNTTYNYLVYVKDAAGNENISWPSVFTTN